MASLCIIPARGGSKRIPRKNIKDFCGTPIISYSIRAAKASKLFDEVMVSTDDEQIAEIAKSHDASVPFLRDEKNADDFATTADVIQEVQNDYKKRDKHFDYICCLYPTAPLIQPKRLIESFEILASGSFHSVFPIVKFGYPIQRSLRIDSDTKLVKMVWPEFYNTRSQDLEARYHDAGQFYWLNSKNFAKNPVLFAENSASIVLSELEVQDIDNEDDWKLAEMKYQLIG